MMWRWAVVLGAYAAVQVAICADSRSARCPVGFTVARKGGDDPVCYKLKRPESYEKQNSACAGNLYSRWWLERYDIPPLNVTLQFWSDYKNMYPGGPLVQWPHPGTAAPRGKLLSFSSLRNVLDENAMSADELCAVTDSTTAEMTAVDCSSKHYRHCVVPVYKDKLQGEGCGPGYARLYSPLSACLQRVDGARVTWSQARELCAKRNGTILQRGWRFANHPALRHNVNADVPLGITMSANDGLVWAAPSTEESFGKWMATRVPRGSIEPGEWSFSSDEKFSNGSALGALRGDSWIMVNESYVFYTVICEQPVTLPKLRMNLTRDPNSSDRLRLTLNANVKKEDISCYTDGEEFPKIKSVDISNYAKNSTFTELKVDGSWNGYYWCVSENTRRFQPAETEKVLHLQEQEQNNTYALKVRLESNYSLDSVGDVSDRLLDSLADYIYAYSKFIHTYGNDTEMNATAVDALAARDYSDVPTDEVVYAWRLRRAYLDARTLLVHTRVSVHALALPPSVWRGVQILYMKPVYFCRDFDSVPSLPLGGAVTSEQCTTYRCVGDYTEGVQWLVSDNSSCQQRRVHKSAPTTLATSLQIKQQNDTETTETSRKTKPDYSTTTSQPPSTTAPLPTTTFPPPTTTFPPPTTTDAPTTVISEESYEGVSTATLPNLATQTTEIISTVDRPPIRPTTTPPPPIIDPPTMQPPDQVVLEVLENLESMLHDDNGIITTAQLINAADQMDVLLELGAEANIPGRLLHLIDEVGARMELNGSQSQAVVRDNIGFVVADSNPEAPVRGLRIAYSGEDVLSEDTFHVLTGDVTESFIEQNASEVLVKLPETLIDSERRITFVVFRNSNAFSAADSQPAVNSRVLSVNVTNLTSFADGDYVDIHLRPLASEVPRDARRACAYWHFNEDDTGYWSQAGCTFIASGDTNALDVCRCTHLTHFAEIIAPRTVFSESNESALEAISIAGCVVSMVGLLVIALTAVLFRAWRKDFVNKVWLQLSGSILMLVIAFLVVVFARFNSSTTACMAAGVLLHYATLASFAWMSVAAVLSYRRLVLVFTRDASHKLLRACAFAWGAPAIVVGILLAVDPSAYSGRFTEVENTTASFCYPTGVALWAAVYSPIAAALLVNWLLFALIVHSVFASRRVKRHGDTGEALRCATVSSLLVFLFGLPWIFGLFSTLLAFAYLFAFTATFQGFVLFLFFVVGNKKTRDMWLNKLKIKQSQKVPVTSSTYKSSGWRGGGGGGGGSSSSGVAAMEEAGAKPRSLMGRDDEARFS